MKRALALVLIVGNIFNIALSYVRQTPCTVAYYSSSRRCTGWFWGKNCYYIRNVHYRCCPGYGGSACNIPICKGGAIANSCNLVEGNVQHKNGTVVRNSGGTCVEPYTCINCNEGYFAPVNDSSYCTACRSIQNCNLPLCTQYEDTYCGWCVGELRREVAGYNIYTGKPDNTQCQRACSWRDGNRCFPGTCTGDQLFPGDCKCAVGFNGSNCAIATSDKLPVILEQTLVFEGDGDIKKFIVDMALADGKFWTNIAQWSNVSAYTSATYTPDIDPQLVPSYITGYTIGIANVTVTATLTRGMNQSIWSSQKNCSFNEQCSYSEDIDLQQNQAWNTILDNDYIHMDIITYTVSTRNGGIIRYMDRENDTESTYNLIGVTETNTLELEFDTRKPSHCFETSYSCSSDSLAITDFNRQSQVVAQWSGWEDVDSGLYQFVFSINYLIIKDQNDPKLEPSYMLPEITLDKTEVSTTLSFSEPGPYAVEITAFDRAGNHKSSRRIVLFDNKSVVEITDHPITVLQANEYSWINSFHENIEVQWTGSFINKRHHSFGWLNRVGDNPDITEDLDDTSNRSLRNINTYPNIQGIVRAHIAYRSEGNGQQTFVDLTEVPETYFKLQKMTYKNVDLTDGKRLTYNIRAFDVFDEYAESNITVMVDLSPPVIQNLRLTKGNFLGVNVHSVLELNELIIEWDVYDVHSGLSEIKWRLFDNFTHPTIEHGRSNELLQSGAQTLEGCIEKYQNFSRGHKCYCSPYNGCYHQHYQIRPLVTNTGTDGIHSGKDVGVHDFDYYIEVTATNNARLTSVEYLKFTIDVTPPHEGTVYDGILGEKEVDFQQSLRLSAHWDDFFDKESSVWFYMYGFDTDCLIAEDFDVNKPNAKTRQTYGNSAAYTAPGAGTFYATVVAYNHALDASSPVCSDGVTVDSVPATVSEVVVQGALTINGVIQDTTTGELFLLSRKREIEKIVYPTQECVETATATLHKTIQLIPHRRHDNGTERTRNMTDCSVVSSVRADLPSYLNSASHLDVSWNVSIGTSGLHDFELGLSSTDSGIPDIMNFETTHGHQHKRLYHPGVFSGETFFVVIKSITKSAVTNIQSVGPFSSGTPKPEFIGNIRLTVEIDYTGSYLIAKWDKTALINHGDPNPLNFELAIGHAKGGEDMLSFRRILTGGSCTSLSPTDCAAVAMNLLSWHLHIQQTYYVSIKATNAIGMSVIISTEYYAQSVKNASIGIVHDIDISSKIMLIDIDDIDYQTQTNELSTRWFGFEHPFENIQFHVCLAKDSVGDVILKCETVNSETTHTFSNLELATYQTYYVMVIAETSAGNVTAVSDGVTIVIEGDTIKGIVVLDGPLCLSSSSDDFRLDSSHHSEDERSPCLDDVEYQSSTNHLQAHWILPDDKKHYLTDIYWMLEERAPITDVWTHFKDYTHVKATTSTLEYSYMALSSGRSYRTLLKVCAGTYCFAPVQSSGVTVIPNPPAPGSLHVTYTQEKEQIEVRLTHFKDPDIQDLSEARDVIDHYEWAITEGSENARLVTKWNRPQTHTSSLDKITFTIDLRSGIKFTKCWKVAVRGYNKVGHSSVVTTDIRNCSDINQVGQIIVIDALGLNSNDQFNTGEPINLDENSLWPHTDIDYTPYNNILSAVWPKLRHGEYTWAVLEVRAGDVTTFYEQSTHLELRQPCSHPDTIKCGTTDLSYINIYFEAGELKHGRRYITCINASAQSLVYELWTQELREIHACSDGVTVDLTPPLSANVWIGHDRHNVYQTSVSELSVNWNSFIDVEEEGYAAHTSGITNYEVAIGTTRGGVDVLAFTDVGLINHQTFHGLRLLNGQTYFAAVKGFDFTGQSSVSYSGGVKIDKTPPAVSDSRVHILNRHITSTKYIDVCWTGVFSDVESGISHYSWSVGTRAGYDNVMLFTDTKDECTSTPENQTMSLREGHHYFINVKAYNKAGQYSVATSWAFLVDISVPEAGYIFDGSKPTDKEYIDMDYIVTSNNISTRWKGFNDPHTPIQEYFVSLGTCKGCEDIKGKQPVGLKEYVEFASLQIAEGIQYYVTVTACNTAELCISASSDGFIMDLTPPIKGYVFDGTLVNDVQFQATGNYIGCKWYGFSDPQSEIANYVWRVGTTKGADDIVPTTDCHKMTEAFIFDLPNHLPENKKIICAVRAYNKAGKYVEAFSNGFIVDKTPPVFNKTVTLSPIGSILNGTSILRSLIRVHWKADDNESFIDSQYISISSHIGGDFNRSSVQVEGFVQDFTLTGLDLHDGSFYDIKLITCNGAKLCTESILRNIVVDSTPPTIGAFAINTDHAAALTRQPDESMTWTNSSISLAWLGFEDFHTGIRSYSINIGSKFMGDDLNQVSKVPYDITHNSSAFFLQDGLIQRYTFSTQTLSKYSSVFISISAKNNVGLSSDILHSNFNLLPGGILELVRRCDSHTCFGHCVCASHGKMCTANSNVCVDTSGSDNQNIQLEVRDFIDVTFPNDYPLQTRSPVSSMLSGKWAIGTTIGKKPQWYECSIGESAYDSPQGIFDEILERVWHDAGQNLECIFSLQRGKTLVEREQYSLFVRVWYDKNTFGVFKSPGVIIHSTPPLKSLMYRRNVKETIAGGSSDIDFIRITTHVVADWTGKFISTESIWFYHVYISTSSEGNTDMHEVSTSIPSTTTMYNITGLKLEENTKYYTVVQAYNLAGLHSTAVSDGFMLDLQPPTPGVVMDGKALTDIDASNDSRHISAFWYGFSDLESGIMTYEHCVSSIASNDDCNEVPMSSVGISLHLTYNSPQQFTQGTILYNKVRARDVVGHVSETVSSDGIQIDTTPPVRISEDLCQNNVLLDHSFESTSQLYGNESTGCIQMKGSVWQSPGDTCVSVLSSGIAYDGLSAVVIQGAVTQAIHIESRGKYRLTFFTSAVWSNNLQVSALEGYVTLNDESLTFFMYERPQSVLYKWQKHTYYFQIDDSENLLSIGTTKYKTAFALDDVILDFCLESTALTSDATGHVNVHTVFVHDWSSLHASWKFTDHETDIEEYLWAIGTVEGGTQLQSFKSVGRRSFGTTHSLDLEHNTDVFVTVVAINAAQLRTVSYSTPIKVDLTAPIFRYIYDGHVTGEDLDYQTETTLVSHWDVFDQESGVVSCSWAIGTSANDISIKNFVHVNKDSYHASKDFHIVPTQTIIVTVKCVNGAGLTSIVSSDGVKILQAPPSLDGVMLDLLTTSATQFSTRGNYHGNKSEIKFRWSGFKDNEGVDSFQIQLEGNGVILTEAVPSTDSEYNYARFTGLDLEDGEYTISVTAVNEIQMYSDKTSATLFLLTELPQLTGMKMQTSWNASTYTASANWRDVFFSNHPMFYEVTVRLSGGSEQGIIQWQETSGTEIDVFLEAETMPVDTFHVLFSVRSVSFSGLFVITHGDLLVTV